MTLRRVGDVPQITTSRGATRILFEGAVVRSTSAVKTESKSKGTHEGPVTTSGIDYYNDLAWRALEGGRAAKFPAGSIIVREKLSKPGDTRPQLLAVMVKRSAGFNPGGGDWEFLTVDGALTKIRERQKKGSCLDCHASQRESDFVFPQPSKNEGGSGTAP